MFQFVRISNSFADALFEKRPEKKKEPSLLVYSGALKLILGKIFSCHVRFHSTAVSRPTVVENLCCIRNILCTIPDHSRRLHTQTYKNTPSNESFSKTRVSAYVYRVVIH